MSPRDTAHAYDLTHACRHLYRYSERCPICTPVEDAIDGTSWDAGQHAPVARPWYRTSTAGPNSAAVRTAGPGRAPWWWSADEDNLSGLAVLLILAVTGAAVLVALVVGQRWQDQRCAAAAGTATACVGWVA